MARKGRGSAGKNKDARGETPGSAPVGEKWQGGPDGSIFIPGWLPAVLYGQKEKPVELTVDETVLRGVLRICAYFVRCSRSVFGS